MRKNIKHKKQTRKDTDKYEIAWRPITIGEEGRASYRKTVWEALTYVGPGSYNSGHIDFILDNMMNEVGDVIRTQEGVFICRKGLSKDLVKFKP